MGYVLLVTIESKKPVKLWVVGKDTLVPNCVYFDRNYSNRPDGLFQGKEVFRFPLPIEPENIEIKATDSQMGNSGSIKVDTKVECIPLNTVFSSFKRDDYDDFLLFAKIMAKYGGTWGVGTYKSPRGLWKCEVVNAITSIEKEDFGEVVDTPASMDHTTGTMYWVVEDLHTRTVPNRFVVALHEFYHYIGRTTDEKECDHFSVEKAWSMGFSKFEIEFTMVRLFGDCVCPHPCDGAWNCDPNCPCRERAERTELTLDQLNAYPDLN
jgi:hypothetical protein